MSKVWIDGTLVEKLDARVSVFDHAVLFGDGLFAGLRLYGGKLFRPEAHLDRLFATADAVALPVPLSRDALLAAVDETVRANGRTDGYVRVTVTRGAGTLGTDPRKCSPLVVVVAEDVGVYPRELDPHGIDVITLPAPPGPRLKTLSYQPQVVAKAAALRAGCFDAIVIDGNGDAVGGIESNLFAVVDGTLVAAAGPNVFPGVTRAVVLELAASLGVPTAERSVPKEQLFAADELFLTSTAAELMAVARVDGTAVGTGGEGPVTRGLRAAFRAAVRA